MLKLSLARPSHKVLPTIAKWRRFKSTRPVIPLENVRISPTPVFEPISTPGIGRDSLRDKLDLGSDGITDAVSASTKSPLKIAHNEIELFGSAAAPEGVSTDIDLSDPNALPHQIPLEALGSEFTEKEYASALVHGRGIHLPFFHPRTHDIPVANIQFRSHYPRYLDLFTHFATHAASSLGIPISRPFTLPTKRTLWTVLRGPFAHKKSQENFERRVHKRAIKAWDADAEVVDRWVRYLRRHAMAGVGMRVTKWERAPLGIGESQLAHVMDRLQNPATEDAIKIKVLGEMIVRESDTLGEDQSAVSHVERSE